PHPTPPRFPYTPLFRSYCTTPEEYGEQRYEGGHTLYGPATQPFVTAHAARLAAATVREGLVCDVTPARTFDLHHHRYLAAAQGPDRKSTRLNSSHVKIS